MYVCRYVARIGGFGRYVQGTGRMEVCSKNRKIRKICGSM